MAATQHRKHYQLRAPGWEHFAIMGILLTAPALAQTSIVLDGNSPGRQFDGIGAASAGASSRLLIDYPEPYRSQVLDYLFKPNYGASLQHLKVEIGADVNSTDGSEPSHERFRGDHDYDRGYEWWLMNEARKRNPSIILDSLAWGAPGWIGNGKFYSEDMTGYVADFIVGGKRQQGVNFTLTGSWNERAFEADYVKLLHSKLAERAPGVRLVCCDEFSPKSWRIASDIVTDPTLARDVDIVSVHYPRKDGKLTTPEVARTLNKPLWSSEDQPDSSASVILSREWQIGGRSLAKLYIRNYLEGGFTATEIWSPVTSYYDILAAPNSGLMYANTPWSGNYNVQGAIWATAHTTQFAQPGWRYLDKSSGYLPEQGSYVALKSQDGNWSVVLETIDARAPQAAEFRITGGLADTKVHVWETNADKTFEHIADLHPKGGVFRYTFDPNSLYSLTTTTGQAKGMATPPPPRAFPLPYRETFDSTPVSRSPRYLADQDGAFEVHLCTARAADCLEQVITAKPIPWGPLPNPWTLTGDEAWKDYQVSTDVYLPAEGSVALIGRIDSANVFADRKALWPSGYVLSIAANGHWSLTSYTYKKPSVALGEGESKLRARAWHQLRLRFAADTITADLDSHQLASVRDKSHVRGMVGVGTEWNHAQFDNLSVDQVQGNHEPRRGSR
jgi:hypothetical protein